MIDDLIEIAEMLVAREEGRPKQASLKRAVSTAYYALFHALADLCGRELIGRPSGSTWANYRLIYRSLDHGNARKILDPKRSEIAQDADIRLVGLTFSNLQRERQVADYDPEFTFSRADSIELVEQAKQAIGALRNLPATKRKSLAAQLIAKSR